MYFIDEEQQTKFHKTANTTLQVVAQIFESMLFDHGYQAVLIDSTDETLVLGIDGPTVMENAAIADVEAKINDQFRRSDGRNVCKVQTLDPLVVTLNLASPAELKHLN